MSLHLVSVNGSTLPGAPIAQPRDVVKEPTQVIYGDRSSRRETGSDLRHANLWTLMKRANESGGYPNDSIACKALETRGTGSRSHLVG